MKDPSLKISEICLKISEVCELFSLTHRAVRFYEERALLTPLRDARGNRFYNECERRRLEDIARLRRAGLSLEEIGQILTIDRTPDGGARQTAAALEKLTARIKSLGLQQRQAELTLAEVADGVLMTKPNGQSAGK